MSRPTLRGLALTEIAFGGAPIGDLYDEIPEDTAHDTVRAAWDAGIRHYDTAPHYGVGVSEQRLGAVLADYPRDEYILSTKVGRRLVPTPDSISHNMNADAAAMPHRVWDFSRDGIMRTLDDSLRRLRTDHVDIVFLHDPVDSWDQASAAGFATLADLRAQGAVSAIGVGMNESGMLARFIRETDLDVVMLAGRYTLFEQDALDDVLSTARRRDTAVIAAGVFNSGLLAQPNIPDGATYDYRPASDRVLTRARRIAGICKQFDVPLPAAAMRFPLLHPAVVNVVLGMSSAQQVKDNTTHLTRAIPDDLWTTLIAEGLLRADAPRDTTLANGNRGAT